MAGLNKDKQDYKGDHKRNKETICSVHRDCYQFIKFETNLPENHKLYLLNKIETAFNMGKSMNAKLYQYKNNYDDGWWKIEKTNWTWDELKNKDYNEKD